MKNQHFRLLLSLLIGAWWFATGARTARAYNPDTHTRLAELAVRTMSETERLPPVARNPASTPFLVHILVDVICRTTQHFCWILSVAVKF